MSETQEKGKHNIDDALAFIKRNKAIKLDPKTKTFMVKKDEQLGNGTLGKLDYLKKHGYRYVRMVK